MRAAHLAALLFMLVAIDSAGGPIPEKGLVTLDNHAKYGYTTNIETPNSDEPSLRNINIKFPKLLDGGFKYAYSKALYSRKNRTLLYYRPADISFASSENAEIYITGDVNVLSCLSVVNVYHKQGEYGMHPPSVGVAIDLSGFLKITAKCSGNKDARNVW
jgi:hypothetical protein